MYKMTKVASIETLRGITIVLVVIGHVISSVIAGGNRINDHSIYHYFYDLFLNIRMPLFTVISGWVYALHPVQKGDFPIFMRKKVRRLLVPLWVVGSIYFLLQAFTPGTNRSVELADMWRIYVYPYTLYWYLPALFLLFFSAAWLDIYKKMDVPKKWGIVMLISLLLCLAEKCHVIPENTPNLFAFRNAFYLAPFFYAGIAFCRFRDVLFSGHKKQFYLVLLLLGVFLQQCSYFMPDVLQWYEKCQLPIFIGLFSCACLIVQPYKNSFFIWLGKYAYTIYLFHGFGISATRIFMKKVWGIQSNDLIFVIAVIAGVFLPILVEKICIRVGILRMLFLGKKW